ncbi:hypothetical protein COJ46_10690 [Bacillus sp. AFS077874]|nr:hypothetical protein CON00_22655 [Bacillus sp. AFS096315]PFM80667.1 hypothetical protein COJ46_10690 [Bacillus sp. AFS077874]
MSNLINLKETFELVVLNLITALVKIFMYILKNKFFTKIDSHKKDGLKIERFRKALSVFTI